MQVEDFIVGKVKVDLSSGIITDEEDTEVAEVRLWDKVERKMGKTKESFRFQDELANFIVKAINKELCAQRNK